jgi:aspartate ammonia-lyase
MARVERDALGALKLPDRAYYGVQTARAVATFPVSGMKAHPELIRAYVLVKKAAALANLELRTLDRVRARAIVRAANQIYRSNRRYTPMSELNLRSSAVS